MAINTKMLRSVFDANRQGHVIKVTRKGILEFLIEDMDTSFMRTSVSDTGDLVMVDPAGGPYIAAEHGDQPGMQMSYFDLDWGDLFIQKMYWNPDNSLSIECYCDKPVEWKKIK
jgi:hypothetical protein